jgi:gluconokinase
MRWPAVVVVMGASGSGKTTIGTRLANAIHAEFADGDRFHPAANVEKMRNGIALADEDRWPWLAAIAAHIDQFRGSGRRAVIACSALKRSYRDILIGGRPDVRLVYLKGDQTLVARRIARRRHFMPAALLPSQFETLEEPGPDEHPIIVSIEPGPSEIVGRIIAGLRIAGAASPTA